MIEGYFFRINALLSNFLFHNPLFILITSTTHTHKKRLILITSKFRSQNFQVHTPLSIRIEKILQIVYFLRHICFIHPSNL